MRWTGSGILLAALLALPVQSSAGTDPELAGHPDTCDGAGIAHHVIRAKSLTRRSFDVKRWEDASPVKASEKRKRSDHKLCLERKGKRKLIASFVDEKADQFEAYRETRLLTPYDCGSAGYFAIPCYIIECESHFNWWAQNPSGASWVYQLLGWGAPAPTSEAAKLENHRIAASLWAGGAGASHWVCA